MTNKEFLSVTEYSKLHRLDGGNLRKMLAQGRIPGAFKVGRQWVIPADAKPPADRRIKSGKYIGWRKRQEGEE